MASPIKSGNGSNQVIPFPGVQIASGGEGYGGLPPTNIPTPATAFIGRAALVDEIFDLVIAENVRILTLTGPGGVGKTRLAFKACEDLLPEFEDGIFFVSLAPITDPVLVVPAIAATLGLKESGSTPLADTLADYLRDRRLVLLLDNFEQVTAAGPDVTRLLADAPGVRLVVTSRIPTRLYGEYEYPVPPMDLPGGEKVSLKEMAQAEAIQLFIARGKEVRPGFSLTPANAPAVAAICNRLDGLPLAMELAAARLRLFSPQALLTRLDKALPLLTGGARDLPARQQTLRNAIEWSYNLLSDVEQKLFALMSVFVGGCTLEAAQSVCSPLALGAGDLVDRLESLIAQNLLRQREQADGEPRFWMLATIREYAMEKLAGNGALKDARQAHARFFAGLAQASRAAFETRQYEGWLPRLDTEYDNLRAALRWSLDAGEPEEERAETALRMAANLDWYWDSRGYLVEGSRWLDEALTISHDAPAPLRARALWAASWLAQSQNDFARAKVYVEESLDLYRKLGDKIGTTRLLTHLGIVAAEQENYSLALSLFEQSLAVWRELNHVTNIALLLGNLCFLALYEGNYSRAISFGEEGLALLRQIKGATLSDVGIRINLGLAFLHAHDYARGVALLKECLVESEALGSKKDVALAHVYLGLAAVVQGDLEMATPHYKESLILANELGNRLGIARSLVGLAGVNAGEDQVRQAVILSSAAHAIINSAHVKLVPAERELHERTLNRARTQLGESAFTEAWGQGQEMTEAQSIAVALNQEAPPPPRQPLTNSSTISPPAEVAPAASSTNELTSRELGVLRLVASGLTNKEIAERLVLSARTVEAHLYSIFNKLNVTTRSAATRYAVEHGLQNTT